MTSIPKIGDLYITPPGQPYQGGGKAVVIDNGAATMKAGFAGDILPLSVLGSFVGRILQGDIMVSLDPPWTAYCGQKVFDLNKEYPYGGSGLLRLRWPLKNSGVERCWDEMEKIWHHIFYNELQVAPEEHPVLLTEKIFWPKRDREKITSIMFETFHVPAMYLANDAVLSLYAAGKSTGLSVDIGEQVCTTVPVYEGYAIQPAYCSLDLGGADFTERMETHLTKSGYSFKTREERKTVNDIKDKTAYIKANGDIISGLSEHKTSDTSSASSKSGGDVEFELPDGQVITVKDEYRHDCCEPLFDPARHKWSWIKAKEAVAAIQTEFPTDLLSIMKSYCGDVGLDPCWGIHEMVRESTRKCDPDIQKDVLSSIVLSSGTSEVPHLTERFTSELKQLYQSSESNCSSEEGQKPIINVIHDEPDARRFRVFRGGAMLADSSGMQEKWVTKDQYDEYGPVNVLWRCF